MPELEGLFTQIISLYCGDSGPIIGGIRYMMSSNRLSAQNPMMPDGDGIRHAALPPVLSRVEHIIVITQENRSFDQFFGHFPGADGIPPEVCLPNPAGPCVRPFHATSLAVGTLTRPLHSWEVIHEEWNEGRMDGFVRANGPLPMGYYLEEDIPYLYHLAQKFVLCDQYFCSVLGPTMPNRLYAVSGTSAGLKNDPGLVSSLTFSQETVFDQLQEKGISWRYYGGSYIRMVPAVAKTLLFNPLLWFPHITGNPAMMTNMGTLSEFFEDARACRLPAVAFLAPGPCTAGNPPINITFMMRYLRRVMSAVQASAEWENTLVVINFDEAGGFYDHVPPPVIDEYGPGIRVPCILASPLLSGGRVDHTVMDHTSVLKMIQERHGLPPLTERNRLMPSMSAVLT